jgi:hypothetical protein
LASLLTILNADFASHISTKLTTIYILFSVKTQPDVHTTTGWQEVKGWQSRDNVHQSQDRWDATQSRYTPLDDGIYLVSANLIISHSTANSFQVLIAGDDNKNQFSGGQNYHSAQNAASTFSLTVSCSVKLKSSNFVSVFVNSEQSESWSVLGNSSISVILMSLLTNPDRAGINALTTSSQYLFREPFMEIIVWSDTNRYGSTYNEKVNLVDKQDVSKMYVSVSVSGLYFVELGIRIEQIAVNFHKYSVALCIGSDGNTVQYISVTSTKNAEGPLATSRFGISAFGVVYLTKGLNVFACLSGGSNQYKVLVGVGFSLVKIVPRDRNPGLRQTGAAVVKDQTSRDWTVVSDWSSRGESSLYRFNRLNSYGEESMNTLGGTYLLTSSLSISENTSATVPMCIGKQRCNECFLQLSIRKGGLTMSGAVWLPGQQSVYTCVRHRSVTVTRSAQFLPQASANTTFFFRHSSSKFTSNGLKSLNSWTSDVGLSHKNINVTQAGLYLVAINIVLRSAGDAVLKVSVNLCTNGRSKVVPGLNAVSWTQANHPMPFGLTSLVRISVKSSLHVTVYSGIAFWSAFN